MVHFDSFVSHFLLKTAKFQSEAEALQVFQCGKRTLYHMPLTDTTPTKKKSNKNHDGARYVSPSKLRQRDGVAIVNRTRSE
jgi:hypothetical protein